jgi:hypothetical protein
MAEETTRAKDRYKVLGSSGLKQSGGIIDEEWNRNLVGIRGVEIYKEMSEQDATCVAVIGLICHFIRQAEFLIAPAEDTPEANDAKAFVESALEDMEQTWSDLVSEILTMLVFGWAFFEITYKMRMGDHPKDPRYDSRESDGKIGWRCISLRGQETLDEWKFDEDGSLLGMVQDDMYASKGPVFIPMDKAALFRVFPHKNNPEGRSILRGAYRSYYYKKRIEELEAINIENDATGMPVLFFPPELADTQHPDYNASKVSSLEKKVSSIKRGQYEGIALPAKKMPDGSESGWGFELMRSGGSRQVNADAVILRYRAEIATAIMYAGFLYLGQGPHGSYSLASSQTTTFSIALGAVLDDICETFTRYCINPLMSVNGFPRDVWPYMIHSDVETPDITQIADFVQKLVSVGAMIPTAELSNKLAEIANLPVDEGGDAIG